MDVEYAGSSARATTPAFEATLTITPPPVDRSRGTACRATRNGPLRLVSRHASQSASERSSTRPTDVDARVVHDDVEPAGGGPPRRTRPRPTERPRRPSRRRGHRVLAPTSSAADAPPARRVARRDVDRRPVRRERPRGREADPRRPARDERDPAGQLPVHGQAPRSCHDPASSRPDQAGAAAGDPDGCRRGDDGASRGRTHRAGRCCRGWRRSASGSPAPPTGRGRSAPPRPATCCPRCRALALGIPAVDRHQGDVRAELARRPGRCARPPGCRRRGRAVTPSSSMT